jgi:hypothetical protein
MNDRSRYQTTRLQLAQPTRSVPGRLLLLAFVTLALILGAGRALATDYYVGPGGSDSNTGTSSANPWATIGKANAVLRGGDVCHIQPGIYSQGIDPANNGSAGSWITYVGNVSDPRQCEVNGIKIFRTFVSIKGVGTTQGKGASIEWLDNTSRMARNDSISFCYIRGGMGLMGSKDCVIYRNTVNGQFAMQMDHGYVEGPPNDLGQCASERNIIRRNAFNIGLITWKAFVTRGYAQQCVIDSNQISAIFSGTSPDIQGRYLYHSYHNIYRDNRWTFEATNAVPSGDQWVAFALRDSSYENLFERDTILCGVASGHSIGGRLVNAGNAPITGKCFGNRWNGCFFKTTSYVFTQDDFNSEIIENSVFASKNNYALWLLGDMSNCIIRNNTFYSADNQAMRLEGDPRGGGNQFYNNIFYADSLTSCPYGGVLRHGWITGFTQNNNLFFARTAASGLNRNNMAVSFSQCSGVGTGTSWANATGNDADSRWGSPLFVDSSFATFDPHLRIGSLAIGRGQGGADAGAYPFADPGPDTTAPAAILNLVATPFADHTVRLEWTAPGDDGLIGMATSYDLRWSTDPIDESNFDQATPVPAPPVPGLAGVAQLYMVEGLQAGTSFYFAIKTRDDAGNVSEIGTSQGSTFALDGRPPSPITDLSVSP